MVLINHSQLRRHFGKDAYIGEAMCAPPMELIRAAPLNETTIQQVYKELSEHGRKLFQTSVETIKTISWKMVANMDTVPVFLLSMKNALAQIAGATGAALEKAVCVLINAAARFWEYISSFFSFSSERKKTLETTRDEVFACKRLLERFGDTAVRVIRWIASHVSTMVNVMLDTVKTAAMHVGDVVGQFASFLYNRGTQGATEFMLMTYTTYQEMSERTTNLDFIVRTGNELSKFGNTLKEFISKNAFRAMDFMGITGGMTRVLRWMSMFAKGLYVVVLEIIWGIYRRAIPSLAAIFTNISASCGEIYEMSQKTLSFIELVVLGKALQQDTNLSPDSRGRIAYATEKLETFTKQHDLDSWARPWLAANVLKDLYYRVEPNPDIVKQIIEDRTGQRADVFLDRLNRRYTLLETEIWVAYGRNMPVQIRGQLREHGEFIGGLWDWFGCGKNKKKCDKGKEEDEWTLEERAAYERGRQEALDEAREERRVRNMSEMEQIARDKSREGNVFAIADTRDPILIQRKLTEIEGQLKDAEDRLRYEEGLVQGLLQDIQAHNREERLEMINAARKHLEPGKTRLTAVVLKKSENLGDMRQEVILENVNLAKAEITQLEFEKSILTGRQFVMEADITRTSRRYTGTVLAVALVGGIAVSIYAYGHTLMSLFTGQWDGLRTAATGLGLGSLFNLWYTRYTNAPERFLESIRAPDIELLNRVAETALSNLHNVPLTSENYMQVLEPYANVAESVLSNPRSPAELRNLAQIAVSAISDASKSAITAVAPQTVLTAINTAQAATYAFLQVAQGYMLSGMLPSNMESIVQALKSAGQFIPSLPQFFRNWRGPSFSDLSPAGLLSVGRLGAGEGYLDALKKLFTVGVQVPIVYSACILLFVAHVSHGAAIATQTNARLVDLIMTITPQIVAGILSLSGPMMQAVAESATAQNQIGWGVVGGLLSIAMFFFPGYGWLVGLREFIPSLLRRGKPVPKLPPPPPSPPPAAALPEPQPSTQITTVPKQRIPALEAADIFKANEEAAQVLRTEIEAETTTEEKPLAVQPVVRRKRQGGGGGLGPITLGCSICFEPATLECNHCEGHFYCGTECAQIDWMGAKNHTVVHNEL